MFFYYPSALFVYLLKKSKGPPRKKKSEYEGKGLYTSTVQQEFCDDGKIL